MTSDDNPADWDAAYLLGALSPEETAQYDEFLAAKPAHAAALTEYADIPAILDILPRDEALALIGVDAAPPTTDDGPSTVSSLAVAAEKRRTRSRRTRFATVIASAAALLVVGGIVGYTAIPRNAPPGVSLQAMAPGERAGVTASLAVSAEDWGTRLDWNCQYTKDWATAVASYDLVVTTRDGKQQAVATWRPTGDQATNLAAATVIPASNIRTVEIRETGTTTPLAVTTLS